MKNKHRDEDRPVGRLRLVEDFLPPPEKLVFPWQAKTLKVTILLDEDSVKFFKHNARRLGTKYQRMMREVLKRYAAYHSRHAA